MPLMTILGDRGLRFFGEMSAANAHEIKNALAVINENAGLLGDLVARAEKGIPFDIQRLKRLSHTIMQQVDRADEIAKSTNRFAHSVDNAHGPADLGRSLVLVQTMAMRFATQRHIGIEVVTCKPAITMPVQPFMLLHLLWLCLRCAMGATDAEKNIQITMKRADQKVTVRFGCLSHLEKSAVRAMNETDEVVALLQLLNGRIEADSQVGDLVLTFG